ncbi:MAG: hypothetical protein JRF31_09465, partial [Deltaproteobacteria bacterium]|nr:hypothetical protein [Deltaproteobacteria bacterium]
MECSSDSTDVFAVRSLVHYRPFGGGQGTFEITAVLVGGLGAGKMDGPVPNGGLTCRGVIVRVLVHGRL